ncbi:MAG: DUF2127 domain-containing protein [Acidothermales bacterium]|nr:DUF2127 domain-containing protein [Acidothermales bacterium]
MASTATLRTWFRSGSLLDRGFAVGILLKGLDGLLELVGGALLLFVSPATIQRVVVALTHEELSEDPHDLIAVHLLHATHGLTAASVGFAAAYLIAHGVVKVVLVVAVLQNRLWAYPWMIVFLLAFIGYQLYRIALVPTAGLIALTVFDVAVVWLTYREYRKQRARRHHDPATENGGP